MAFDFANPLKFRTPTKRTGATPPAATTAAMPSGGAIVGFGGHGAPIPGIAPGQPKAGWAGAGVTSRADAAAAKSPTGTESGPGILESWFNQRASGTDPAFEYAMKRGGDALDTRMAAGGSYNSGARGQGLSDMYSNLISQREGQLDSLAGGASGEHQGRLDSMFRQGLGLAGGESGINTSYDLAAGGAMSEALKALLGLTTAKAGVDSQANQGMINNAINLYAASKMGGK